MVNLVEYKENQATILDTKKLFQFNHYSINRLEQDSTVVLTFSFL